MFPHEFMHEACAFIDIERENVVPVVDFVEGLEVDGFAAADRPGEVGSGSDVVGVVFVKNNRFVAGIDGA